MNHKINSAKVALKDICSPHQPHTKGWTKLLHLQDVEAVFVVVVAVLVVVVVDIDVVVDMDVDAKQISDFVAL